MSNDGRVREERVARSLSRAGAREKCMDKEKISHRLALLEGVSFSPADLESIVAEIEDLERVLAELEEFGQGTPWISQQTQPQSQKGG